MKKLKRMHLWLGLIFSVLILIESVTGLMMEEPQWFGGQARHVQGFNRIGNFPPPNFNQNNNNGNSSGQNNYNSSNTQPPSRGSFRGFNRRFGESNSFMGIIEQLHRGTIDGVDVHWVMDLTAIAMMFLSLSGIYMSIRILSAESKGKARRKE